MKRIPAVKACQFTYSSSVMGGSGLVGREREKRRRVKEEGRRDVMNSRESVNYS